MNTWDEQGGRKEGRTGGRGQGWREEGGKYNRNISFGVRSRAGLELITTGM